MSSYAYSNGKSAFGLSVFRRCLFVLLALFLVGTGMEAHAKVLAGGQNMLYIVRGNGDLLYYKHTDVQSKSSPVYFSAMGVKIGAGWDRFAKVIAAGDGVLYGIEKNGHLKYYKHAPNPTGENQFNATNIKIGSGWNQFAKVIAGGNGILYALAKNGHLKYYQHKPNPTGTGQFIATGAKIGAGWQHFARVIGGGNGVLYAIKKNGRLLYYRHKPNPTKEGQFAKAGLTIGSGWKGFADVIASVDEGVLYALRKNGQLLFYRHTANPRGRKTFDRGVGLASVKLGTGWSELPTVQGVPVPAQPHSTPVQVDTTPAPSQSETTLAQPETTTEEPSPVQQPTPVQAEPAQPQTVPAATFASFLKSMKEATFKKRRFNLLRSWLGQLGELKLSAVQVQQLLKTFKFDKIRARAATLMSSHVLKPLQVSDVIKIIQPFTIGSSKVKAALSYCNGLTDTLNIHLLSKQFTFSKNKKKILANCK